MMFFRKVSAGKQYVVVPAYADFDTADLLFRHIVIDPIISPNVDVDAVEGELIVKTGRIDWRRKTRGLDEPVKRFFRRVALARGGNKVGIVDGLYYRYARDRVAIMKNFAELNEWDEKDLVLYDDGEINEYMLSEKGYVVKKNKFVYVAFHGSYKIAPVVPYMEGIFTVVTSSYEDLFQRSVLGVEWYWPLMTFKTPLEYDEAFGNTLFAEYRVGDNRLRIQIRGLEKHAEINSISDLFEAFGLL